MKQRILVAVVGIPALLAVLCIAPAWATALLLAALSVIAAHELLTAVSGPDKARRWTVLPALCCCWPGRCGPAAPPWRACCWRRL